MPSVSWAPWSVDAFGRARDERKPVLLCIGTTWSQACRTMDAECYADPRLAALITARFVPVRVDADRRPDISERYSLGGWPTTAFLTSDGDLIGGGTFIHRDRLGGVLHALLDAFDHRAAEIAARADRASGHGQVALSGVRSAAPDEHELIRQVFSSFDPEYGGFGTAPKFPLVAPIRLALRLHREHADADMARIASVSLDGMGWGPLHDDTDGGFFRYADARTWNEPNLEKLLDVNASLIDLYVEASGILGAERYGDRAQDVLRYAQNWLADQVDGGWAGSQRADPVYYARSATSADEERIRPPVDRTVYANWNGAMVSAVLRAAHAIGDDALGAFALTSLERVLATCYTPGDGVAHYVFGGRRTAGMLDDQIAVACACLDAFDATGNVVYQMMAEELARHARRTMWDDEAGAFRDRTAPDAREAVGLMRSPLVPFVGNCEAAGVLHRLATSCGEHEFTTMAESVLAALAPRAAEQGPQAAHYLLALRAVRLR